MTTRPKKTPPRRATVDDEARALAASSTFQALLAAGRASPAVPLEELDRRLGPLTAAERARAEAHLRALEQLEAKQGSEVTAEQDRLIELVLTGIELVEGRGVLSQLAADSGFSEAEIRAVAATLRATRLKAGRARGVPNDDMPALSPYVGLRRLRPRVSFRTACATTHGPMTHPSRGRDGDGTERRGAGRGGEGW